MNPDVEKLINQAVKTGLSLVPGGAGPAAFVEAGVRALIALIEPKSLVLKQAPGSTATLEID